MKTFTFILTDKLVEKHKELLEYYEKEKEQNKSNFSVLQGHYETLYNRFLQDEIGLYVSPFLEDFYYDKQNQSYLLRKLMENKEKLKLQFQITLSIKEVKGNKVCVFACLSTDIKIGRNRKLAKFIEYCNTDSFLKNVNLEVKLELISILENNPLLKIPEDIMKEARKKSIDFLYRKMGVQVAIATNAIDKMQAPLLQINKVPSDILRIHELYPQINSDILLTVAEHTNYFKANSKEE